MYHQNNAQQYAPTNMPQNNHAAQYNEAPQYNEPPQQNTSHQPQFDPSHAPGGKFYSIKVHGGKAAVEFKADTTRKGVHTIRIEAAKGANKQFNWNEKVSIQLTHTGLIDLLNAFLFIKPLIELKHYGVNNDKSLKVEYQQNKLFVQVAQASKGLLGIPVSINEAIRIGQFALDQYLKNYERLSADVVVQHLQRASQM